MLIILWQCIEFSSLCLLLTIRLLVDMTVAGHDDSHLEGPTAFSEWSPPCISPMMNGKWSAEVVAPKGRFCDQVLLGLLSSNNINPL